MDPNVMVGRLQESGSIEDTGDGTFRLTEEFHSIVKEHEDDLQDVDGDVDGVSAAVDLDEQYVEQVAGNAALLARWLALEQQGDFDREDVPKLLVFLTHVEEFGEEITGVPEPFTPVPGDRVAGLVNFHPRAIIYVWREECRPCDIVKEWFEELFPEPPDDIGLYAVYGPDWAETVQEQLDVTVGPTTLFVVDGKVDCRHIGARTKASLEKEIENLRMLSCAPTTGVEEN